MLADLVTATDELLRQQARRLAARLVLDQARTGPARARGTARMRPQPADRGGDLDIDASFDAIVQARAERRPPPLEELTARDWGRPALAICLLVDASGSMNGSRLAAAALTAAACTWRAPADHAVLSFSRGVTPLRHMGGSVTPTVIVDRLLALRGHGVTALGAALRAAGDELAASRAGRRVVLLMSDCRATDEEDPLAAAASLPELLILAPEGDSAEAEELARRSGARLETMGGPADAPGAVARLLD